MNRKVAKYLTILIMAGNIAPVLAGSYLGSATVDVEIAEPVTWSITPGDKATISKDGKRFLNEPNFKISHEFGPASFVAVKPAPSHDGHNGTVNMVSTTNPDTIIPLTLFSIGSWRWDSSQNYYVTAEKIEEQKTIKFALKNIDQEHRMPAGTYTITMELHTVDM